jgi:hypothetical protein
MLPIEIPDNEVSAGFRRVNWAEGQSQYYTLPAIVNGRRSIARWRFTEDERRAIADGANLDLSIWYDGNPMMPHAIVIQGTEQELPKPKIDGIVDRSKIHLQGDRRFA